MQHILHNRGNRLFLILGGFFIANAIIAEFIGVKIFSFEATMGMSPWQWTLFGQTRQLDLTAGVLLWPIVFVMTDIINEYFGRKGVRFLSYLAACLIAYGFVMVYSAIQLAPNDWWDGSGQGRGIPSMQSAFSAIFGQGLWIIVASLIAFLVGQILDAFIFYKIKSRFGEGGIWIRATVSTLASQLIDSYLVLYIAFVVGSDWSVNQFLAVGTVNYVYKVSVAVLLIPVLYLVHQAINRYLGQELAEKMRQDALQS
jgi:uncharacterized integral membrane protein (TIGR00697 family)